MLSLRNKKPRLISGIMIIMMLFMSVWMNGVSPVSALADAVVNLTTGVGYGDDLQSAIDAAAEGETIEVYSGDYQSITIDKSIALVAPNGPESVSITISESEPAISIGRFSYDLTIRGFTIISTYDNYIGPGITVDDLDGNTIVVEDCVFKAGLYAILFSYMVDANITIRNNSFSGEYDDKLIHFESDVSDSSVLISDNHFEIFGEAISGGGNQYWGYIGRTVFTVSNNTFDNGELAIYIPWLLDGGSCVITDNVITNCDYPIQIYEIGYYYREESDPYQDYRPCSVLISGNMIDESGYYGIDIEYLHNGSVTITENTIKNLDYHSVYIYEINPVKFGHDVSVDISGNTFSGSGAESIYIDGISSDTSASAQISIQQNNFISNDTALYFDEVFLYDDSWVVISNNKIQQNYYGIYFNDSSLGNGTNARIDIKGNLFSDNETGLFFYNTSVNPTDSRITITLNNFLSNDFGIYLRNRFYMIELDQLIIELNQFNDNHKYGLYLESPSYAEGIWEAIATNNWWGSESGPTPIGSFEEISALGVSSEIELMSEPETGDPISDNMIFDPWLAKLVVTPSQNSLSVGETLILTAQILDNEGEPVIADGLSVQFTVSGAHSSNQRVPFGGTTAIRSYPGSVIGTDTIQAEVFFNGEASGLETEIQVAWVQVTTEPTEPTTGESEPVVTEPTESGTVTEPTAAEETDVTPTENPKTGEDNRSEVIVTTAVVMLALALILGRKRLYS